MDRVILGMHILHILHGKTLKFSFQTEKKIWRRSRDFSVNAKNSKRKWAVSEPELDGSADYVPTYELPQLFRWRGYLVEVKRSNTGSRIMAGQGAQNRGVIFISYVIILFLLFSIRLNQQQYLYSQDEGTLRICRRSSRMLQSDQSSECHRSLGRLGKCVLLSYYNTRASLIRSLRTVPTLCGAALSRKPVGPLIPSSYRPALLNH